MLTLVSAGYCENYKERTNTKCVCVCVCVCACVRARRRETAEFRTTER